MTSDRESAALKRYYAARAPEYDANYDIPERQSDLRLMERTVSTLFVGKHVLEVACGTGYWTKFIARSAASIIAIDAAEETLAIARKRKGNEKVRFRTGDAYALSPYMGKFDAAFAGFWLSHVPRQRMRKFIAGLNSVLPPYSLVAFTDNEYVAGQSTPIADRDEHGNTYQIRRLKDGSTHKVIKNFISREELYQITDGLGFHAQYSALENYWLFSYETK